MYGKHFASMYERSMVGSGAIVFAVMGYVIANYQLDKTVGAQVTLNPQLLSAILGEKREDVEKAIEFLCAPDPRSTSKDADGRRLVKIGEFDYRVVNGAKYTNLRNEEERREQNRLAKQRERERDKNKPRRKSPPKPLTQEPTSKDEHAHTRNFQNGLVDEFDQPIPSSLNPLKAGTQ